MTRRRLLWMGGAAAVPRSGMVGHWTAPRPEALADRPEWRFGTGDFTVTAWVDGADGEILSKYDPSTRRGFTLAVRTNQAVTSSSNYRNLHFGIDNARDGEWRDCGRPGNGIYVMALAVFQGGLYAGTCEPGAGQRGRVFRYAGATEWAGCGAPDSCNAVSALAVHAGSLYAGVSRYRLAGSSLPESTNPAPGGKVYRYRGGGEWEAAGRLGECDSVYSLAPYQGSLMATPIYAPAGSFRYEGGGRWRACGAAPGGRRVTALGLFEGELYGGSFDHGGVYRYAGASGWTSLGTLPDTTQTYSFAVYQGRLYVSTWPKALVYRYQGGREWTPCGRLGQELEAMALAVYNGKMYGGTLPLAQVYRYEGGSDWVLTGRVDHTPDVRYRRAWSLAVYQGKLYCGTLPSGRVWSYEAGRSATWDHELGPGRAHLAAVRAGRRLQIYLDGKPVARSDEFDPAEYDLTCRAPLEIGGGGRLRDLRLYRRALSEAEIRHIRQHPG